MTDAMHDGGSGITPEPRNKKPRPAPEPEKTSEDKEPPAKRNRPRRPDVQAAGKIDFLLSQLEPDVARRALDMVNAWYQQPEVGK